MLLSMTGYGEARYQSDQLSLSIELRALNNRYLKVSLRAADPYHLLEAEFEKVALYELAGRWTHVAKQIGSTNLWSSKLGAADDIRHELNALAGLVYGQPRHFMRRSIRPSPES